MFLSPPAEPPNAWGPGHGASNLHSDKLKSKCVIAKIYFLLGETALPCVKKEHSRKTPQFPLFGENHSRTSGAYRAGALRVWQNAFSLLPRTCRTTSSSSISPRSYGSFLHGKGG